jgi:copper homeostasis protein
VSVTVHEIAIEGCVDSVEAALAAEQGGASRLELCDNLSVGGTTPSAELVAAVTARVGIPVFVMIRPRAGIYVNTEPELEHMRRDIDALARLGADGIVFGVLDARGQIDAGRTRELVDRARPLPVTIHRAFDVVPDLLAAAATLIECGVRRVLTAGGPASAVDGLETLAALVEHAGDHLAIMAGGGVRGHNAREIVTQSGVREVHARCELDPERIRGIRAVLA